MQDAQLTSLQIVYRFSYAAVIQIEIWLVMLSTSYKGPTNLMIVLEKLNSKF